MPAISAPPGSTCSGALELARDSRQADDEDDRRAGATAHWPCWTGIESHLPSFVFDGEDPYEDEDDEDLYGDEDDEDDEDED